MTFSLSVLDSSTRIVHRISTAMSRPSDEAVRRHFSRQKTRAVQAGLVSDGDSEQYIWWERDAPCLVDEQQAHLRASADHFGVRLLSKGKQSAAICTNAATDPADEIHGWVRVGSSQSQARSPSGRLCRKPMTPATRA